MIRPVVVFDAATRWQDVRDALHDFPAQMDVVVRDVGWDRTRWYLFRADQVLADLADAEHGPLTQSLRLDDRPPALTTSPRAARQGMTGIVLDGDRVLGLAAAVSKGVGESLPLPPPSYSGGGGSDVSGGDTPTARGPGEPSVAYPRVDCPPTVAPRARFTLRVGLSAEQQVGTAGGPVNLAGLPERFDLVVQVMAQGFDFPGGIRRTLTVDRARLDAADVELTMVAPGLADGMTAQPRLVEIEYAYEGVPVGRAWRAVLVTDDAELEAPDAPARGGELPVVPQPGSSVDLTVTITEGWDPGSLLWLFTTPHDVRLPQHQVETTLHAASAHTFAVRHVKDVARVDGSSAIRNHIRGIGRTVAHAMPAEFWVSLGDVWSIAGAEGRAPSLMVVSSDPYVPWELASTEDDYVDPALVDQSRPSLLGAQVRMGRWLPAGPSSPRGVRRPTVPPPERVGVARMAVVVGDYAASSGFRPLPLAKEEGAALLDRYPSISLQATEYEVISLLEDRLQEEGGAHVQVQAVHVACHGEVDPANASYNGIVLSDTTLRLDPVTVKGSQLTRGSAPFVFLNACQLGTVSSELLGDYGGMAGAFLSEGARGFVAPLWSVNDRVARDVALDFYRLTIDEGMTVGEAMRSIRGHYHSAESVPPSTPLAYVFYGHPDLRLTLQSSHAPPAGPA